MTSAAQEAPKVSFTGDGVLLRDHPTLIRIQLVRGLDWSSSVIAWFTQGHYSHVDTIRPGSGLIGARDDCVGGRPPGVRLRPAGYLPWARQTIFCSPGRVGPDKVERYERFIQEQIGKPYDSRAIWGFVAGRDWRDPGHWTCSELVAAGLEHAGVFPRLVVPTGRISPNSLALALSAAGFSRWDIT